MRCAHSQPKAQQSSDKSPLVRLAQNLLHFSGVLIQRLPGAL